MRFNLREIYISTVVLFLVLAAFVFMESNEPVEQTEIDGVEQTPTVMVRLHPTISIEQIPTVAGNQTPWKLVWQDEFNDHHLDKSSWTAEINDWGGGNQELQYYTNRHANVFVENSLLNIVGRKEPYLTRNYTSARLTSTRSWTYGRFEVRAQLPEGLGIWPAIWLRSAIEPYGSWAASGEIDIMEMLGNDPTTIYGTLQYGSPWPHNEQKQGNTKITSQDFHVYSLEWDVYEIKWFVDGVQYLSVDSWYSSGGEYPAPFDQPFNIVLNLAIGGTWPGNPDGSTLFPQKLLIDYVRVYQK